MSYFITGLVFALMLYLGMRKNNSDGTGTSLIGRTINRFQNKPK